MNNIPATVISAIAEARVRHDDPLAVFIYDLAALSRHVGEMMSVLPEGVELYYAIKANSEASVLRTLASLVDGFEVSSGGEIERLENSGNLKPFIFSGPGKLDSDLRRALGHGECTIHVESLNEITRLARLAQEAGRVQPVFIRINPQLPPQITSRLAMAGTATPFGIDETDLADAVRMVDSAGYLQLKGFHVHAMSHQQDTRRHQELMAFYLQRWPHWKALSEFPQHISHLNVGGGIGVNYLGHEQFDWPGFCTTLRTLLSDCEDRPVLRFEPGRYVSAFCGYYAIEVLDRKISHGKGFLVCRGGTHQFRLPVAQGHDHPVIHLPQRPVQDSDPQSWTVVGQLCTPKDILSRDRQLCGVSQGDILLLPLAGAYGYNISHADFLCHPRPEIIFLSDETLSDGTENPCSCA
ncbi:type III PLP-dependent enzyme [Xenorhabdus doucetiae]|uniref:Achromobactin biosynthetic and transport gene lysA n=1 Tax=Xenorhabdus doucetiae TaxID=351671 RepID=A0A068QRQ7_9GAMM|nr:type III PLP-dependent enzyme [Xenorhabdus doucetiae]TYP11595.1 diaminopimelate decarboxylase [Xenorhabdus doucetiae]CDG17663.1 Achromobactin biosynthetic and transport gene lysA [Xenorhabdus doucetiae]